MAKRRNITTAMRVMIFQSTSGVCHLCKLPIHAERGEVWHVEHIKPLWLGGDDTEKNMAPTHVDCHSPKTREEAGARAKSNRQAAKHIGAVTPKQPIASRGFARKPRQEKIGLPGRRNIYQDA